MRKVSVGEHWIAKDIDVGPAKINMMMFWLTKYREEME
jgi:hypothetical protein